MVIFTTLSAHGTAVGNFACDQGTDGFKSSACGLFIFAHFLSQSGNKLGFCHRFGHSQISLKLPELWGLIGQHYRYVVSEHNA